MPQCDTIHIPRVLWYCYQTVTIILAIREKMLLLKLFNGKTAIWNYGKKVWQKLIFHNYNVLILRENNYGKNPLFYEDRRGFSLIPLSVVLE